MSGQGHRCVICTMNKNGNPEHVFHVFPKDKERCLAWVNACNIQKLKELPYKILNRNHTICSKHFSEKNYIGKKPKSRLCVNAVPDQNLKDNPREEGTDTHTWNIKRKCTERTVQSYDYVHDQGASKGASINIDENFEADINFGILHTEFQSTAENQMRDQSQSHIGECDITFGTFTEEATAEVEEGPRNLLLSTEHECHLQPHTEQHSSLRLPTEPPSCSPPASAPCSDDDCNPPGTPCNLPGTQPQAPLDLPQAPCGLPASPVHHEAAATLKKQIYRTAQVRLLQNQVYRLKKRIEELKLRNIKTPKELLTKASQFMNPKVLNFFKWQVIHAVENESRRKYKIEEKGFALAIYSQSPQTYKFLSSVFHLPPVQTLQSYLRTVSVNVGWSKHAMSVLKNRADASQKEDTLCGIVFGSMSIRECLHFDKDTNSIIGGEDFGEHGGSLKQANRALVFMVKGLAEKWKLVLGCFFYAGTLSTAKLKELYEASIREVQSTGHRVIFSVCDQEEEVHRSLFEALGMTREDPSLEVEGERIHFFYDSPHLLKSLTNTLLKYDMKIGDSRISWDHIKQFIETDQKQIIRLVPKVTSKHVCSDGNSEISVSIAAQVMSQTVAGGIYIYCVSGKLPKQAVHTAEFVQQVNRLFLHLNNSHALHLSEVVGGISSESIDKQLVSEVNSYLASLQVCASPGAQTHCIDGLLINLASLQAVCQELSTYKGKFSLASQLNHDCLETLFARLRDTYEDCTLTAYNFLKGLKAIITNGLVEDSKSGSCEAQNSHYLALFTNWESEFPFFPSEFESEESEEDSDDTVL